MWSAQPVHLGVDLAWGVRNRTGLAVTDSEGALVASCSVRTDEEIVGFCHEHAQGPVVAAIDAPLIVRNAQGRRRCEAEVQAAYGRYGAGPYPSNLGNPAFAEGTRGARLCELLGLDLDPSATGPRRAIEVYPHPAMIALFGLDYVIPYKGKAGRSLEGLKAAFERLLGAMQTSLPELQLINSPRWEALRRAVLAASRKADLERAEDEIDGIFCAHLAYLWQRDGAAGSDVFGDGTDGYIVVPRPRQPLPAPQSPLPTPKVASTAPAALDLDRRLMEAIKGAAPGLEAEQVHAIWEAVRATLTPA